MPRIKFLHVTQRLGEKAIFQGTLKLSSPLTGEGINPASVSGEAVAHTIIDQRYRPEQLDHFIKKHRKHQMMLETAGMSPLISLILSEICAFLLRYKLINFEKFEMA